VRFYHTWKGVYLSTSAVTFIAETGVYKLHAHTHQPLQTAAVTGGFNEHLEGEGVGKESVVASESGGFQRGDFKHFFLLRWDTSRVNSETYCSVKHS
jgi:hypothetical protein